MHPTDSINRTTTIACSICIAFFALLQPCSLEATELGNVRLTLVDGSELSGTIDSIRADGMIQGTGFPKDLSIEQITQIKTDRPSNPVAPSKIHVRLLGGGILLCDSITLEQGELITRNSGVLDSYPIEFVTAIVWTESPELAVQTESRATDNDTIIVASNGAERVVSGILESIDPSHLHVNFKNESRKIALSKINSVVVADLKLDAPTGARATITRTDGSAIVGSIQSLEKGQLTLAVAKNLSLPISTSAIQSIKIASDRIVFLSDLDPIDNQRRPVFAAARPWQRDLSVERNTLKLRNKNGRTISFKKGIGTQSFSSLTFENPEGFDQFRVVVGIDSETGGRGDCEMSVEGDGISLWKKRVQGLDVAQPITIDVTGMKHVTLIVRPGKNFDLGDHANWCDARLTKSN